MLIYILLAIISSVLLMSYIVIRKKSETNKSFFQTIKTCSDENFILQCGIISNTKDALVALKIRNVIAKLGRVPPEYISPHFRFTNEMLHFYFWNNFDSVIFANELQKEIQIDDIDLEKIKHPYSLDKNYDVKDMINIILKLRK